MGAMLASFAVEQPWQHCPSPATPALSCDQKEVSAMLSKTMKVAIVLTCINILLTVVNASVFIARIY